MNLKVEVGKPQRDAGRAIVAEYIGSKGGSEFAWEQRFENRENILRFSVRGTRYRSSVGYKTLADLKNDPLQESKLRHIWDSKEAIDGNG